WQSTSSGTVGPQKRANEKETPSRRGTAAAAFRRLFFLPPKNPLFLQSEFPKSTSLSARIHRFSCPSCRIRGAFGSSPMGSCESKRLMPLDQQLHKEVSYGCLERIRDLRAQGADLESTDSLGKTPLMKASAHARPGMALVLIEMGANVNAYRRGSYRATALHHAADSGAKFVVELLITYGADPYIRNDYGETSLELARRKGHMHVVRAIERQICLFRGWMREKYGPDSFMTNKIWAVVLPCEAQNPTRPLKLELAIYHASQLSLMKWRLLASLVVLICCA
ncbi:unnamed protein product, partial [Urochloa humidicola]